MMRRIQLTILLFAIGAMSLACEPDADQTSDVSTNALEDGSTLLPVLQDGRWGYIDTTGTLVVEPRFKRAFSFSENLGLVEADSGFGYIREDGSFSIPPQFEDAWHFAGGRAPVQTAGTWQFVDEEGDVIDRQNDIANDPNFTLQLGSLVEKDYQPRQLQLIHSDDQYGFQTPDGDVVIEPQFQNAWYFSEGLARVMIDSLWGFIDRSGTVVIEPAFDLAWEFDNGLALVMVDGKYGYINRSGQFVWEPTN